MESRTVGAFGDFPRTTSVWTLVKQVQAGTTRRESLDTLLQRYRAPLKAHLVVRKRLSSDAADDVIQGFIVSKILESGLIESADRQKGRFRSLLLTALDRYLIDQHRKKMEPTQALDAGIPEPTASDAAEEEAFNVAWARQVIDLALERMKTECDNSKRPDIWGVFSLRVIEPSLSGTPAASYEDVTSRFGFKSAAQASNVLMTGKRMFRRAMEAVVAEYADSDADIREEVQALQKLLDRSAG